MKLFPHTKAEQFNVVIRDCEKDMEFLKQMVKWFRKFYPDDYDDINKIEESAKEFQYILDYLEEFKLSKYDVLYSKKKGATN